MNFWEKTKKPILCLAPMADVTDAAFRHIIAKQAKKDYITYTEFVSADGLILAPEKGRKKLLKDLEYSEIERPIVAQFFTSRPEMIEKAAALAVELGFDGVDINMGCPDKSIEKQGAGAALMKNPLLARELIKAAKRGVLRSDLKKSPKDQTLGIPVSVKTRLGYSKDELEEWLPELLAEKPAAIIIHARTRKEMSKVSARWERIKRAVEIRDELQNNTTSPLAPPLAKGRGWGGDDHTFIIGNGDVENMEDAIQKCKESGADGAMLGRAVFGNPWLFSDHMPSYKERPKILLEHIKLFDEKLGFSAGGIKSFAIMKKHFKEYLKNPELRDLKSKLMRTENAKEAAELITDFRFPSD